MRSNRFILKIIISSCLIFSFMTTSGMIPFMNQSNGYYGIIPIIIMALFKWSLNNFKVRNNEKRDVLQFGFIYSVVPKVVIYGYTLYIILSGISEKRYLSSNIQTFINGVSAIAAFYLLEEDIFQVSSYSLIIGYIIGISIRIFRGDLFSGGFEYHDLAFAVGYLVIYIALITRKWTLRSLVIDLLVLIMILLAGKRIGIFALIFSFLMMFIFNRKTDEKQKNIIIISGVIGLIVCFLFVHLTLRVDWLAISKTIGFDLSGRGYYYAIMSQFAHFGPDYLGLGRNACQVIFTEDFKYFKVSNLHSDILRMYVECGFWLFGMWCLFYLIIMPLWIYKKYGSKSAKFVMIVTIYTFIVYSTDNIELYLISQFFYVLTVLLFLHREKKGYYIK